MYKSQFDLQHQGVIHKGELSSNIFVFDSDDLLFYHWLYHFTESKKYTKTKYVPYQFNRENTLKLIQYYQDMNTHDIGILFITHEDKKVDSILEDVNQNIKDILYEKETLRTQIINEDNLMVCIYQLQKNLDNILRFSDGKYQMTVLSDKSLYVYSNHELVFQRPFYCENDYYLLSQITGYMVNEIALSHLIFRAFPEDIELRNRVIDALDSQCIKTIKLFAIAHNSFYVVRTTKYFWVDTVKVIKDLFMKEDYRKYLNLSYDMYLVFYYKGEL